MSEEDKAIADTLEAYERGEAEAWVEYARARKAYEKARKARGEAIAWARKIIGGGN